MVATKASNPCGTPTLPAAVAADGGMTVDVENCLNHDSDSEVLSLPDIFFDYGDLNALKNSSPSLHVWNSDRDSEVAVGGREASDRGDEMKAVLRCFDLVSDVICKRVQMCEHLFNEEMKGLRPVRSSSAFSELACTFCKEHLSLTRHL